MAKREWNARRYWLIGASSGLGEAIAKDLSRKGARLILSARDKSALNEIAGTLETEASVQPCDVCDLESLRNAFDSARAGGTIDGIIFCAGVYEPMTAQTLDVSAAEKICDVNFAGCVRSIGVCLPHFVERGEGHIVIIGSLSGIKGIPGSSVYGASKAGLIHFAEGLKADLDSDHFTVQIINPGFIKTRLTDKNDFKMPFLMEPDDAAARTIRAMESSKFRINYPKRFAALFKVLGWLPDGLYFPAVKSLMI